MTATMFKVTRQQLSEAATKYHEDLVDALAQRAIIKIGRMLEHYASTRGFTGSQIDLERVANEVFPFTDYDNDNAPDVQQTHELTARVIARVLGQACKADLIDVEDMAKVACDIQLTNTSYAAENGVLVQFRW